MISDAAIPPWNKLRVVMLYALRYQQSQTANIATLINLMLANGVSREDARVCLIVVEWISDIKNLIASVCPFECCWD